MKRCMTSTEDEVEDGNLLEADSLNSVPKKHPKLSKEVTTSKSNGDKVIEIVEEIIILDSDDEEATKEQNVAPVEKGPGRPPSQPTISNCKTSKAKYEKQPTPVCDAIMREYSKRKKLAKLKGNDESPDVDDSFIKEIIEKHKRKSNQQKNLANETVSSNKNQSNSLSNGKVSDSKPKADQEDAKRKSTLLGKHKNSQNDTIPNTVKKDDVKLVVSSKEKTKTKSLREIRSNGIKALVTNKIEIATENTDSFLPPENIVIEQVNTFDIKVSDSKCNLIKCKEDDSSCLPRKIDVLNPSAKLLPLKQFPSHLKKIESNEEIEKIESNVETGQLTDGNPTRDVPTRLKLVSESITSILNNRRSFIIDNESHKLKEEKLLELKEETPKRNSITGSIDVKVKNEFSDHLENINTGFENIKTTDSKTITLKKLYTSEPVNEKNLDIVQAGPTYLKNKFQFVMDYYTSYNDVFNSENLVFQNDIPFLSEILLLCINDMKECLQRMKNAESVSILDLRNQEIQLAYQAYLNAVMSFGEKFFNVLDSIVQNIMGTKTKKALMITLIYFITNAVYTKEPAYKGQLHKIRDFLKMISITYKYYHPLILEVFEIPNHLYEEILANLIKIMENCYDRRVILIPNDNLFVIWAEQFDKDKHSQSRDISLMDELILELNIPSSIYEASHESSPKSPSLQTRQRNMHSYIISDTAAQLFNAMHEKDCTSQRIEKKLDKLLSYFNDYKTHSEQLALEQPDEKNIKYESIKPQIQVKHAGLDSLFTSYLKSTTGKVKN